MKSKKKKMATGASFIQKIAPGVMLAGVFLFAFGINSAYPVNANPANQPPIGNSNLIENDPGGSASLTDQVILKYKDIYSSEEQFSPASNGQMQRISNAAGVSLIYSHEMSGNAHVLRLPNRMSISAVGAISARLSTLAEVEYAEPDLILQHTRTPNDPLFTNQWNYSAPSTGNYGINAVAAWDITTGSPGIVVAVIDTGITNHVEFTGRTVPGYDFISDIQVANDGDGRDSDPSDPGDWVARNECFPGSKSSDSSWHGTHTAGTIGAASNNGMGVAGINWTSKILPVRVLGKCGGYTSDIADGLVWAAGLPVMGVPANANPAKVINISLGGSGGCEATMQNAINSATAAGTTIIVAAGNNGLDASGFTPANCTDVITVAATNINGDLAYYSNYGSTVEISAPGGDSYGYVLSTLNTGTEGPVADTYAYYQGTSMAAPHVSGVASLVYSANPIWTPGQILEILQTTATTFPPGSTCTTSNCGAGIVNAAAAVLGTPTAVDLLSFTGVAQKKSISLVWETASEIDNIGFNLYRATSIDGEKTKLNSVIIPTLVPPGSTFGAIYNYTDTDVKPNKTYFYWLEELDIHGKSTIHSPIWVKALAK